jgi:hypothetical protein
MIIIFTPETRATTPRAEHRPPRQDTHRSRFTNRPLPDPTVEEEAVFTDPFGPPNASAR